MKLYEEQSLWGSEYETTVGFPGGSVLKNPPANARDSSSIAGSGRCPGEGNVNPLQYSCLGNPMHREVGGLQFMGWLRVGHDLETKQQQQYDTIIEDFISSRKCRFT